jgi:Fe-S-cluster containining protein
VSSPDRKAPCPCGSGKKYKSCCYARDRGRAEARRTAREGLALVDGVLKVFLPLVESRGEHEIACRAGCNACCNNFVRCSIPEALLVADWLVEPAQAAVLARFRDKLPAWRARGGDDVARLERLLAEHGGGAVDGKPFREYDRIGTGYALKGNLCPFNDQGCCEIYPVRPTLCRAVHVLDTAEYCTPGRGGQPRVVSAPPLEDAVRTATQSFSRAAVELGLGAAERALPESVAWALDHR